MKILKQEQLLPISLSEAWAFFATPRNLNDVTPKNMVFQITSELPDKMYAGLFITYRLKPLFNIPLRWVTEITHIEENAFFVDEQRLGPYRIWHHEHHFKSVEGGVLMTDIIHYHVGLSFVGVLAERLFVNKMVAGIFEFRRETLSNLWK